ncbi:hypothetical protein BDW74DRAFT_181742 [Aspergillus multicolor]|uniref:uncharacterized protein n=1 Tax=Aspergillus multicolor TaxID=41759 RepID=UPI003CCE460C
MSLPQASALPPFFEQATNSNHAAANLAKQVRASLNRVRAKAKCSPSASAVGKCYRMKKEWRHGAVTKSTPARKRAHKLEEKLDGLVALLKTATEAAPGAFNANSALEGLNTFAHGSSIGSVTTADCSHTGPAGEDFLTETPSVLSLGQAFISPGQQTLLVHPSLMPGADEANPYLDRFRREFIHYFPVIVISPSMTAERLRQDRPLLWLSIMTVASTRTAQQVALSKKTRSVFEREAYGEGARNIDFLLAVLVYTAWDRHHYQDKPISTGLVQLAIALLEQQAITTFAIVKCRGVQSIAGVFPDQHSVIEPPYDFKRKLTITGRLFLDEEITCGGTPIATIKLRLDAGKALDYLSPSHVTENTTMRPQAAAYLKSLQAQLRNRKSEIPAELTNKSLLLEIHATEMLIHNIGFIAAPESFSAQSNERFECIHACLLATKSWVETFLTLPPIEYVGFCSLMYANMIRCLITLYRLSTCDYPEWDPALLHETVNTSWVLEETSRRFAQVMTDVSLDPGSAEDQDSFSMMAAKLQSIKVSWDARTSSMPSVFTPASLNAIESFTSEFLNTWTW